MNLDKLLADIHDMRYFCPPVSYLHYRTGSVPLVLVLGHNASGKSLYRRIVQLLCRNAKIECLAPSMEVRTSPGMGRAFVYSGSEDVDSTGALSASSILSGISTCQGRTEDHVLFLDEPDIGLSDEYAAGAGQTIAEFIRNISPRTKAVFVVTHSRALVRELMPLDPHYVHLGEESAPATLEDWINRPITPKSLSELKDRGHAMYMEVQKILNEVRKTKKGE